MNVLLVLVDSLNRDALRPYGPTRVEAPNLTHFAEGAVRFDRHYVGSLPCMPARREITTGEQDFLWRPWGPLEPFDARLPSLVAAQGHRTALVTDHYHYWEEPANGYLQAFEATELIRGHELDAWRPRARPEAAPAWIHEVERWRPGFGLRYWGNVAAFEGEEDYFPAKVFGAAADWLTRHGREAPFFLQVESFDVHEPFHAPEPYASRYWDGPPPPDANVWPPYQDPGAQAAFLAQASDDALAFLRSQYDAKVTMVDRWFGHLLDRLGREGLADDTAVIVATDHGHDLGRVGFGKQWPHWDSHARIPLLVRLPGAGAGVCEALTTTADLHATVLDAVGARSEARGSRSVLPWVRGEAQQGRDLHLYGTFGQGVAATDGRYTLFLSPSSQGGPLHAYSALAYRSLTDDTSAAPVASGPFLPGRDVPVWKIPVPERARSTRNLLFDLRHDPTQKQDLWVAEPSVRDALVGRVTDRLRAEGAPAEQFARLGLPAG